MTNTRSLEHVRKALREVNPALGVCRSGKAYYLYSTDHSVLNMGDVAETAVYIYHWSHYSIEQWQDAARAILSQII